MAASSKSDFFLSRQQSETYNLAAVIPQNL